MLKIASTTLMMSVFFRLSAIHCAEFAGARGRAWNAAPANSASRMLVAGPASATQTISRRGWVKIGEITRTRLGVPQKEGGMDSNSNPGRSHVPKGMMGFDGMEVDP